MRFGLRAEPEWHRLYKTVNSTMLHRGNILLFAAGILANLGMYYYLNSMAAATFLMDHEFLMMLLFSTDFYVAVVALVAGSTFLRLRRSGFFDELMLTEFSPAIVASAILHALFGLLLVDVVIEAPFRIWSQFTSLPILALQLIFTIILGAAAAFATSAAIVLLNLLLRVRGSAMVALHVLIIWVAYGAVLYGLVQGHDLAESSAIRQLSTNPGWVLQWLGELSGGRGPRNVSSTYGVLVTSIGATILLTGIGSGLRFLAQRNMRRLSSN